MTRRNRLTARPRLEILDERLVLSAVTPSQLGSTYGINAVSFSNGTIKGTGQGQTIAIITAYHDASVWSDLLTFDAKNGLPDPYLTANLPSSPLIITNGLTGAVRPAFSMVNFAGTSSNTGWSFETALDLEMAHAIAPAANILVVEAKTANLNDLINAINAVKTLPSVSVVSMSWGGPEFNGQQTLDSVFTTPVGHRGITFLASSGDNGAGAQWPASSPNVVGVGGTSLVVNSSGTRASESAWSGSGGAISQFVTKPSYQNSAVAGKFRGSPDVAFDADFNTGLVIVSQGGLAQVGGTSMAAPAWAGLIAIADQGLATAGSPSLDGATQTLPELYAAPSGSFYDVTTGPRATTGYDTSTGLGSPNAPTLIGFLANPANLGKIKGGKGGGTGSTGSGSMIANSVIVTSTPSPSFLPPVPLPMASTSSVATPSILIPMTTPRRNLIATRALNHFFEAIDSAFEGTNQG